MKTISKAASAILVAASASCIIPIYMDEGSRFERERPAFIRTVPLAPGGTLRVDNPYGNIILIGWDREDVEILAEETWDDSAGRAVGVLQRGAVVPRVDIETADNSIEIRARPRDAEIAVDRIVHLMIRAPHHAVLKSVTGRRGRISLSDMYGQALIRLEEGDIRVENFSGSLDAELVRGEINAELLDLRPEDAVRLVCGEGPIVLSLEPAFTGRLEADAPGGTLTCEFALDPPAERSRASGKIGTGEGVLVTVSARNGSVTVRKFPG
ncbi:MAG: hypothetical protein JW843_02745 [Candidatus Aminicenantes bacterium]|nr:hypothetical protein [Candidatus Aminicenantes bacterium]